MTDRELMQQALNALEINNQAWKQLADSGDAGFWEAEEQPFYGTSVKAITALRERLAQPTNPDPDPDPLHLSRILHELAGAASMCWTPRPTGVFDSQEAIKHVVAAIAEIRERLAQPEQDWDWRHPKAQALIGAKARLQIKLRLVEQLLEDPNLETTASDMEYWEPLHDKLQERLAQPEQEPVAWVTGWHDGRCVIRAANPAAILPIGIALYTTPPRREWVGLTEEEIYPLYSEPSSDAEMVEFARAIEAKLKEKNT